MVRPSTDEECRALREWAETTPIAHPTPASTEQLSRHLAFMAAALPSKNVDDLTGKMRLSVYASILRDHSNEALAYMSRQACETLDWFPTPRQCLDILAGWRPPEPPQNRALRLCQDYTCQSFDTWIANIRAGQPIGDVPDQWKSIAVEQGYVRRLDDGSYVARSCFIGPVRPYIPSLTRAA